MTHLKFNFGIGALKTNAFLNPNDPNAVFPKRQKEDHIDFRSSAIANSGLTVRFTSRKNHYNQGNLSQYAAIVKTREELDAERAAEKVKAQKDMENELNSAANKISNIELDHVEQEGMQVDSRMPGKDSDSIAVKKSKKKSKKTGNRRRLLF